MIHRKYGGSTAARLFQCPGWHEASKDIPKGTGSSYAQRGTDLHDIQEHLRNKQIFPEDIDIHTLHPTLTPSELQDYIHATEIAYRWTDEVLDKYNLDYTAQELFFDGPLTDTGGSIDMSAWGEEYFICLDYKMGNGVVPAKDNKQGLFYLWLLWDNPEYYEIMKDKKLVFVIIQPAQGKPDIWEVPEGDLEEFNTQYTRKYKQSKQPNPPMAQGPYCKFCPASSTCRVRIDNANKALQLDPKMKETLLESLELAQQLEGWSKTVFAEAEGYLKQGEQLLGWALAEKRAMRKYIDEQAVYELIKNKPQYLTTPKPLTPAQLTKLDMPKTLSKKINALIVKRSSGVCIVPESDPRPKINMNVPDALKNLIKK